MNKITIKIRIAGMKPHGSLYAERAKLRNGCSVLLLMVPVGDENWAIQTLKQEDKWTFHVTE